MKTDVVTTPEPAADRAGTRAAVLEILIVLAVSVAAYWAEGVAHRAGLFPLGEDSRGVSAVLLGAAAALYLVLRRGGTLRDLGFKRPRRWWTVPFWVVGIFAAFVVVQNGVPILVSQFVDLPPPDLSRHNSLAGDLGAAIVMALVLPFTASIPEEIIYRGFMIERLTAIFGTGAAGAALTVALQSVIFGAAHVGWGVGGMIMTALMGAVWGTAFLLCGRNLWIVIFAHSLGHLAFVAQLYSSAPSPGG